MVAILVVEDSKAMRDIITVTLTNAGHEVVAAVDGADGEEKANQAKFDMILTDLYMPNQNGINLIANLRNKPDYANVPILLVTTEEDEKMKEKSKEVGANGWLTKPINSTRLLTAVSKTLEKFGISE